MQRFNTIANVDALLLTLPMPEHVSGLIKNTYNANTTSGDVLQTSRVEYTLLWIAITHFVTNIPMRISMWMYTILHSHANMSSGITFCAAIYDIL